jgi:hypothetical protein
MIWKQEPERHDYDAAKYLTLLFLPSEAKGMVAQLKKARITERAAKDILRASGLELLPENNKHVAQDSL